MGREVINVDLGLLVCVLGGHPGGRVPMLGDLGQGCRRKCTFLSWLGHILLVCVVQDKSPKLSHLSSGESSVYLSGLVRGLGKIAVEILAQGRYSVFYSITISDLG